MKWWSNLTNKQLIQPHVIIELPSLARITLHGKIAEFYKAGLSFREIEKRLGVTKAAIRKTLAEAGIATRDFSKDQESKPDLTAVMRSGGVPFGYYYLDGKLVIDPAEYKIVIEMYRLWRSGNSLRAVARMLNDQKMPTRFGKPWKHSVVKQIVDRHQAALDKKSGGKNGTR